MMRTTAFLALPAIALVCGSAVAMPDGERGPASPPAIVHSVPIRATFETLPEGKLPDYRIPDKLVGIDQSTKMDDVMVSEMTNVAKAAIVRRGARLPAPPRPRIMLKSLQRCMVEMSEVPDASPRTLPAMASMLSFERASGLHAIRSERVVVDHDHAKLEIEDFWLDANTKNVRPYARAEVPLVRIARGPGDFAVYGFRGQRAAEIVVTGGGLRVASAGSEPMNPTCDHARARLDASQGGDAVLVTGDATVTWRQTWPRPRAPVASTPRHVKLAASLSQISEDKRPIFSAQLRWTEEPDQTTGIGSIGILRAVSH